MRDDDPFDQTAARREFAREARSRDAQLASAYDAGRDDATTNSGGGDGSSTTPPGKPAATSVRRRPPASRPRAMTPSRSRGRARGSLRRQVSKPMQSGAGVLLGVYVVGGILLPYLRGGAPAVRAWHAAKFLNRPGTGAATAPLTPAAPDGQSLPASGAPADTGPMSPDAVPVARSLTAPTSRVTVPPIEDGA